MVYTLHIVPVFSFKILTHKGIRSTSNFLNIYLIKKQVLVLLFLKRELIYFVYEEKLWNFSLGSAFRREAVI